MTKIKERTNKLHYILSLVWIILLNCDSQEKAPEDITQNKNFC